MCSTRGSPYHTVRIFSSLLIHCTIAMTCPCPLHTHKHTHERPRPRHRQTYRCTGASAVWVPQGVAWPSFPDAVATYTLRSLWWASTLAVRPRSMFRCTTGHHCRWGHWDIRELSPDLPDTGRYIMTGTVFLFHYIGGERGVRTVAYASIDRQWHSALFF